ncbi:MAG: class I SAM-dependent methyltransferase [Phycisphaera sp.]|nr:MAG: class I SAM-dependent methyltransferase [Phycisphaera sp.]
MTASTTRSGVISVSDLDEAISTLEFALPVAEDAMTQDEEWAVVRVDKEWRRVRLHDYDEVFVVPGLYEKWVYHALKCASPSKVVDLLSRAMEEAGEDPTDLRVLDLGAGNGYVGEELAKIGVDHLVGADICPQAAEATERDRPGLYRDYAVGDITDPPVEAKAVLDAHDFNALVCVAALGFGDIPTEVFMAAFDRVSTGGWVAFNIKSDFLDNADSSGFARMIREMIESGKIELAARDRYVHRLAPDGGKLMYEAIIGRKR